MKYDLRAFNNGVKYYEKNLKRFKGKNIFVVLDVDNDKAFFSIAPLSRAAHNLNCDVAVRIIQKTSKTLDALIDVWNVFDDMEKGVKNKFTNALKDFIQEVDKRAKGEFKKIFKRPELFVHASNKEFYTNQGFRMSFRPAWFKKYKWNELLKTARIIWKQVYNLKKTESVGFGFELIRKAKDMEYPLEDYLDSYAITRAMWFACPASKKTLKASTPRKTVLEPSERTGELAATLLGCELEKNISEPVFRKYKKVSALLKLNRFEINNASFFIIGEGFSGKHIFGERIGYPTPNKKSRWDSPGGIIYQFPWFPQTKLDERAPSCRLGVTDTLPIDVFIKSCCVDWLKMKEKNDALIRIVNKSDKIIVKSKMTNLEIFIKDKAGKRRRPLGSDVEIRHKFDPYYLKKGVKAGTYSNIPGGEMFITPEYMRGVFYGDVVINIDKSYVLSAKNPLVVKCNEKGYRIIRGPKKIINKISEKKKEAMKVLLKQEKHNSLPREIIKMKKENFNKIGEFAINTNPKAELCNYLIVNEKIAGMIHIALGSGFEDDRTTVYHYDIVINAKKQELDIYGVKGDKKLWMMKKGKLAV